MEHPQNELSGHARFETSFEITTKMPNRDTSLAAFNITVTGHRLEVSRIPGRQPRAPDLVFLHEGLGSVSHWKDFPRTSRGRDRMPRHRLLALRLGQFGSAG